MHNKCVCVLVVIAAVLIFLLAVSAADGVNSPGYIDASSSQSGARVYIDGSYQDPSPITVSVSTSFHSVSLEYSDYYMWSGTASVASGQTSSVYASMIHTSQPAPTNVPTYVPKSVGGSGDLSITTPVLRMSMWIMPIRD